MNVVPRMEHSTRVVDGREFVAVVVPAHMIPDNSLADAHLGHPDVARLSGVIE